MKKIIAVFVFLFIGLSAYAQSADVITQILESKEATFGQVCYLAAVQKNLINENDSFDKAVDVLAEKRIIPSLEDASSPIPLVDIAYIYSKLWTINGGLMYRITGGAPRYAFKQFQSDGVLPDSAEPSDYISGAKALSIYTSCVNKYSDFDMSSVSMEAE